MKPSQVSPVVVAAVTITVPLFWKDLLDIPHLLRLDPAPEIWLTGVPKTSEEIAEHATDPKPYRRDERFLTYEEGDYRYRLTLTGHEDNYYLDVDIFQKAAGAEDFEGAEKVSADYEEFACHATSVPDVDFRALKDGAAIEINLAVDLT